MWKAQVGINKSAPTPADDDDDWETDADFVVRINNALKGI